ncbi:hypothetical protein TFLX_04335 [Thermoflexales bacterium]|nr:hypothetical protein TFLX_04335 [Thermoflexales bacterium]
MRREGLLALVILGLLGACGPAAQSPAPTDSTTTVAPTPSAASATPRPPTAAPSTTEAPATIPSVDTPAPLQNSQGGGIAHFRDKLATADLFTLQLNGLPAPTDKQVYQAWLLGDEGAVINLGALKLNPDGSATLEWNSPNGENLLSRYSRFQLTLEPAAGNAAGNAAPTGEIVLAGEMKDEALISARRLFVRNEGEPPTPRNIAFAAGLVAQSGVAIQHVQNAVNAAAIGSLPEMRTHLEHVVNILEGAAGPRFSDYDDNGTAENPGDGFGVIGYVTQITELLQDHETVDTAAADVKAQSAVIQDKSLQILQIEDRTAITAQLAELKELADRLGANAIAGLYQAAQDAVGFEVLTVR